MSSIEACVRGKPMRPFFVFRPLELQRTVRYFSKHFNSKILYAVKTNPEPQILNTLVAEGVNSFEVASLNEVALVKGRFSDAEVYFMHPVKSRQAIRTSYFKFGVRHFALDTEDELNKILEETDQANDLCLHLRFSIPNTHAEHSLSEKFGVNLQDAPLMLKRINRYAKQVGVCFHVGSQCMHPDAYRVAIQMVAEVMRQTDVKVHFFNVGGGFPSVYPGMIPPSLIDYFDAIHEEFQVVEHYEEMVLFSEPGRALVAESTSLIVRVELRKGEVLYINDGTYGSLFDAGFPNFIFPVHLVSSGKTDAANLVPYHFYGPTCDSLDYMRGPFYLPAEIREGDYIEIGQMGAYGRTMATTFNGFAPEPGVQLITDPPLISMYRDDLSSFC